MTTLDTLHIAIRPESGLYATYARLDYKAWYALGEFVDNSTQNFYTHRTTIEAAAGSSAVLTVDITYDPREDRLTIGDDANGMNAEELQRAVQLNKPPADRSGRSEFGLGLKMAACWFGRSWRIVTKRLHSDTEYEAFVDLETLEAHNPESIDVLARTGIDRALHYTREVLPVFWSRRDVRVLSLLIGW